MVAGKDSGVEFWPPKLAATLAATHSSCEHAAPRPHARRAPIEGRSTVPDGPPCTCHARSVSRSNHLAAIRCVMSRFAPLLRRSAPSLSYACMFELCLHLLRALRIVSLRLVR